MFCKSCHEQVKTVNLITKCKCVILKEEHELKIKCRSLLINEQFALILYQ